MILSRTAVFTNSADPYVLLLFTIASAALAVYMRNVQDVAGLSRDASHLAAYMMVSYGEGSRSDTEYIRLSCGLHVFTFVSCFLSVNGDGSASNAVGPFILCRLKSNLVKYVLMAELEGSFVRMHLVGAMVGGAELGQHSRTRTVILMVRHRRVGDTMTSLDSSDLQ